MNLKFNWGTGILLFILLFLAAMAVFLVFASKQNFDLVEKNYYENSVNYQQHIDKRNNTANLSGKIEILQNKTDIAFKFPADFNNKVVSGTIYFYSAANEKNDFRFDIETDSLLMQSIPLTSVKKGRFTVKIDWKSEDKMYYAEEIITIK